MKMSSNRIMITNTIFRFFYTSSAIVLLFVFCHCAWTWDESSFCGTPIELAKNLLRFTKPYGHLQVPAAKLPEPFERHWRQPFSLSRRMVRAYLIAQKIDETDIGGALENPLSRNAGDLARYFVIHDTSAPVYPQNQDFPNEINTAVWRGNQLEGKKQEKVTHVFINRIGQSVTAIPFDISCAATKWEAHHRPWKGAFIHIELIQPRRLDRRGIDAFSPTPGFMEAQYKRLAIVYIAASLRRGSWLIPAFHAVLDSEYRDAHDDPQQFDLETWARQFQLVMNEIAVPNPSMN